MSEITVKEVPEFVVTQDRIRWYQADDIDRYIGFGENLVLNEIHPLDAEKERHFEIYLENDHVGDVRLIARDETDVKNETAEFIIIVGRRNAGIGSRSFPPLIEAMKPYYKTIYCYIHKSNFRSMKLMKKNGFYVEDIKGNELLLVLDLEE